VTTVGAPRITGRLRARGRVPSRPASVRLHAPKAGPASPAGLLGGGPTELLRLQGDIGNQAVSRLVRGEGVPDSMWARLHRQAVPPQPAEPAGKGGPAAGPSSPTTTGPTGKPDLKAVPEEPLEDPRIAWIEKLSRPKKETIDGLGDELNTRYRKLDQAIEKTKEEKKRKGLEEERAALDKKYHDTRVKNRLAFLTYFECTLGGLEGTKTYFTDDLVSFMHPDLVVHKTVAERMELVRAELADTGIPFPSTTVGQSLRGDHTKSKRERNSPGMLAHAMGMAADWHAYRNPHIKDPRLYALLEAVTGEESSHMELGEKSERRALTKAMGKGAADPEKQKAFLDKIGTEFDRLKAASEKLRKSIPDDAKKKLATLHEVFLPLMNQAAETKAAFEKAQRKKKTKPEDLTALQKAAEAAAKALKDKHDEIRPQLEEIFKGWREDIKKRVAVIEQQAKELGVDDVRAFQPPDWLGPLRTQVAAAAKKQKALQGKVGAVAKGIEKPIGALAKIRGEMDSFEAYLASGAKGSKPDDLAKWTADLPALKEAALKSLAGAEALKAEALAVVGGKPPKAATVPTAKPKKFGTKDIARWQKDLAGNDAKVQGFLRQFPEAKKALDDAVAEAKPSADKLAENEKRNKEIKQRVGQAKFDYLAKRRKRLAYLEKVSDALINDLNFVFKKLDAGDPGMGQLTGAVYVSKTKGGGFFEPSKEPETDIEKAQAKKAAQDKQMSHEFGFNKLFYQSMARHGFELAASWEGWQDTMHFELVEGVELIKDPQSCPAPKVVEEEKAAPAPAAPAGAGAQKGAVAPPGTQKPPS
jgi:hypothetical protein